LAKAVPLHTRLSAKKLESKRRNGHRFGLDRGPVQELATPTGGWRDREGRLNWGLQECKIRRIGFQTRGGLTLYRVTEGPVVQEADPPWRA